LLRITFYIVHVKIKPVRPDGRFSTRTSGQTVVCPVYSGSAAHTVQCAKRTGGGTGSVFSG
jgi:hypothetical protein